MSLKFVVKKLEGHSLHEEDTTTSNTQNQGGSAAQQTNPDSNNLEKPEKEPVDDSGTESDDETDVDAGADQEEDDDMEVVDSGVGLNTRSAGKVGGKSSLLPPLRRKEEQQLIPCASTSSMETIPAISAQPMDDTDNHSSEEELEDIIGESRKVYVSETVVHHTVKPGVVLPAGGGAVSGGTVAAVGAAGGAAASGGRVGGVATVEKRKWSEVDQESSNSAASSAAASSSSRTGSGSSGDEEVSGYMGCSTTPVQFCTSPPLNVYKPRRSQSPPPKLFHMASSNRTTDTTTNLLKGNTKVPTGAFRPGGGSNSSLGIPIPHFGRGVSEEGEDEMDGDTRSPHKKHRSTPRPLAARQRPCLDFEKMQQIKTKVVTSWRQGTELSLFCW